MSFILPILSGVVLFGQTFDLRRYELRPYQIYNNFDISKYVEITDISTSKSEFFVVDTPAALRKALDVDIATALKTAEDLFPYQYRRELDYTASNENDLRIILKFSMRTVNESLPYNMPTMDEWKNKEPERIGTHYVKSILYGADYFIVLSIFGKNQQHKNAIRETISSTLGKSGILNSSFKEKFDAALMKHQANYGMHSFGTVPFLESKYIPPNTINDSLILKDKFEEIIRESTKNKGYRISYEMQSLSLVDPKFPSVEINSKILKALEEMELKYEDAAVAYKEYISWVSNPRLRFTVEEEAEIETFDTAINTVMHAMQEAIGNMDLAGDITQFDEALEIYGEGNDTTTYRNWLSRLKEKIKS